MAALQPSAEGQPDRSPTATKSFSQLFSEPAPSPIPIRPTSSYKGEAAVIFSNDDINRLAAPYRLYLVGKFSHGRPNLEEIRKFFVTLDLKKNVSVGLLDYRHVLIRCASEADFNRLWTRGMWQLGKFPMRVFRWTRDFLVHKESSLVPIWIALPALPIHFFDKHSLFAILNSVGRPLFLDSATVSGTRPSVARVCAEVDLLKPISQRVWIAVEGETGFWQKIVVKDLPKYCSCCWRLGHSSEDCRRDDPEFLKKLGGKDVKIQGKPGKAANNLEWQVVRLDKISDDPSTSSDRAAAQREKDGLSLSKAVIPVIESLQPHEERALNQHVTGAESTILTASNNQVEGGEIVVDLPALHQVPTNPQGPELQMENCEKSGEVLLDNHQISGGVQNHPNKENDVNDCASDDVDEEILADLPPLAGNLSPRGGDVAGGRDKPTLAALNVDQMAVIEQGSQHLKGHSSRAKFPSDRQLRSSNTFSKNSFQVLSDD